MSTIVSMSDKFHTFWATWGPWITVSLIPTIIAGLSVSPKTAPEAAWVQKAWDYFKKLMGILSVVTHKDQPGTFQLPLKLGKLVKKNSTPASLIFLIVLGSATQTNCSWLSKTAGEAKAIAIDCSVSTVKDVASSLIPTVLAIVSSDTSSWKQQLEAFVKQFGEDVVACAVSEAQTKLQETMPAMGGSGSSAEMNGINNARVFTAEHKWTFKGDQ